MGRWTTEVTETRRKENRTLGGRDVAERKEGREEYRD